MKPQEGETVTNFWEERWPLGAEMAVDQFFDVVFVDIPSGWRRGQTAFNDDTLPAFEEWVRRNW
jgi:hypothetical protein